jgi:hypothetical protein
MAAWFARRPSEREAARKILAAIASPEGKRLAANAAIETALAYWT